MHFDGMASRLVFLNDFILITYTQVVLHLSLYFVLFSLYRYLHLLGTFSLLVYLQALKNQLDCFILCCRQRNVQLN